MTGQGTHLSVVSPFFNEAEGLAYFIDELYRELSRLTSTFEVILVDDGSTDSSYSIAVTSNRENLRVLRLVQNAGHQAALEAGMQASAGSYVVTMDSDLQHPPSLIAVMLAQAESMNVDVVYAARSSRSEDSLPKRLSAHLYYRIMNVISGFDVVPDAADFRLMSRFVVDTLNGLPSGKVYRLLIPALGFSSTYVSFVASPRRAGESKYSIGKMITLAFESAIQFSRRPLRLVALLGLVTSAVSALWLAYVLSTYLFGESAVGWPSLMTVVLLLGGLTLFSLGVIGEYLGEVFDLVRRQPPFLVRDIHDSSRE